MFNGCVGSAVISSARACFPTGSDVQYHYPVCAVSFIIVLPICCSVMLNHFLSSTSCLLPVFSRLTHKLEVCDLLLIIHLYPGELKHPVLFMKTSNTLYYL